VERSEQPPTHLGKMNTPRFSVMHSGNRSLVLEEDIDYESFPIAAEKWAKTLGLHIVQKIDGPGERLWGCDKDGKQFWLAFDDWFPEISLEPRDDEAAAAISSIGASIGAHEPEP
jgi:hypothetical protein